MSFTNNYTTQLLVLFQFNKVWVPWIIFEDQNWRGKHKNRLFRIFIDSGRFASVNLSFTKSALKKILLILGFIGHSLEARYAHNLIRGKLTILLMEETLRLKI